MIDFLKDIAKQAGNEYASLVADGVDYIDYTRDEPLTRWGEKK